MRKLITAGVVVVVIIVVAVGVALFSANSLIEGHKDYILAQVKSAVGRNVEVKDIEVSLWGGVGARLNEFSMADDPSFSKEPFVRAGDLQVNMKLLPLLRKEFEVRNVTLHRPVINIIKNEKGQFNFSTLAHETEKKDTEKKNEKPEGEKQAPSLLVSLIDVDNGQIRYVDKSQGLDFRADQIDLKLNDVSFDKPVDIDLSAALFGAKKQNLTIKGRAGPLGAQAKGDNVPVEGDLNLDSVDLAGIEKTAPGLKQRYPQGLELAGTVGTKAHFSGKLSKDEIPQITGALDLTNIRARVPQLPQPISDLNAKINFTGKSAELPESTFHIGKSEIHMAAKVASFAPVNLTYRVSSPELALADVQTSSGQNKKPEVVRNLASEGNVLIKNGAVSYRGTIGSSAGTIADADYTHLQTAASFVNRVANVESLSVQAFGGTVTAKGAYDLRDSTPRFAGTANVKAMDLTQVLQSLSPSAPQHIRGIANADLDLTGSGKDWNAIQKTLKGNGKAEVTNGALVDLNLADGVLSGATGVAGAANLVPAEVKNKYPTIFNSKDTEFKQLKGSAKISDGQARTDDLVVSAPEFEIQGKGSFGFDHTVDFHALLLLSQKLTQDIEGRAAEAKNLTDKEGRLELPFILSGKLPGAKPKPDIGYVAQAMGRGAVERGLGGFFQKKSKDGDQTSPESEQKSSDSKEKEKNPKEDILRRFQKSFGK